MIQFTSRELNQYTSKVQNQAKTAPVLITHRGKPNQVLMSYEDYQRMLKPKTIAEALGSSAEVADIDFDPPRVEIGFRPVEF